MFKLVRGFAISLFVLLPLQLSCTKSDNSPKYDKDIMVNPGLFDESLTPSLVSQAADPRMTNESTGGSDWQFFALGAGDYCDSITCGDGEGDCDNDGQCEAGLVCGADIGSRYGFYDLYDVCWPAGCNTTICDGSCGTCGCTDAVGGRDYCSPECLCTEGEGDCDSDAGCEAGQVCGSDNGARYGLLGSTDVCWPAGCNDAICDGSCGTCGCTGSAGAFDYCSPECECTDGEGDCDSDGDCEAGLVCGTDNGSRYGFPDSMDVCWPAGCNAAVCDGSCGTCGCKSAVGALDYCSPECLCAEGEGDCDSDAGCEAGQVCGVNNGARYGLPDTWDVCWPTGCNAAICDGSCGACGCSGNVGDVDYCSAECTCGEGEGDCDNDSQCGQGLTCGTDIGARYGMADFWDACWPIGCTEDICDGSCGECGCYGPVGHAAHCSDQCLCDHGVGDCDKDAHCNGIFCGTDLGASFGQPAYVDVCVECYLQAHCDDLNVCTDDSCGGSYLCSNDDNTDACNDNLYCTIDDACSGGTCSDTNPRDCNDLNDCTSDSCNEGGDRCDNIPVTDDTPCNGGAGSCQAGVCIMENLFISEYIHSDIEPAQALELFNPTGAPIDLDGCFIEVLYDGMGDGPGPVFLEPAMLNPFETFVVCSPAFFPPESFRCNMFAPILDYDGNDAVLLICPAIGGLVDSIGQDFYGAPITEWGVPPVQTRDFSLQRKCSINVGDLNPSDPSNPAPEWDSLGSFVFDDLGQHTFPCP